MFDVNFSDREILAMCDDALSAAHSIARASVLFSSEVLSSVLAEVGKIRDLQEETLKRVEADRQLSAVFLQNLAAGLDKDLVSSLFIGKLDADRIDQLLQQFEQGEFVAGQNGLRSSHLDQKHGKREAIDYTSLSKFYEMNGVSPTSIKLSALYAGSSRVQRCLGDLAKGATLSNEDSAFLLERAKKYLIS